MLRTRTAGAATSAILVILGACMSTGCNNSRTYTYNVGVTNNSSRDVTVWLTKGGRDYEFEPAWMSPEDLLMNRPSTGELLGGVTIKPDKSVRADISGKFVPDSFAVLRVYGGAHGTNDLLAKSVGNPDRKDMRLRPGANEFLVNDDRVDGIVVTAVAPAPPAEKTAPPKAAP